MIWKLMGYGKWAAKLMMIEMFVPGGTLIVLSSVLAGRFYPLIAHKLTTLLPSQKKEDRRPAQGGDLIAYYALRRMQ